MNSEKTQLSQMSHVSENVLDDFLKAMYDILKATGNTNDQKYANDPHYVKAGNIIEMNENQKEIFYGIVKDSYNGLITMPEVEISRDKFVIKIRNSDPYRSIHEIKLSTLELINYIIVTLFIYIYKLQNVNIKFGFPHYDNQKYEFTKLYTLIINIPGMAERITNLSTNIDSNGEIVSTETYNPSQNLAERVIPPRPESGWPSEKLGGTKSYRPAFRKKTAFRRKYRVKNKSHKKKYGRKKQRKLSRKKLPFRNLPFRKR
jgi:hypothetical protein